METPTHAKESRAHPRGQRSGNNILIGNSNPTNAVIMVNSEYGRSNGMTGMLLKGKNAIIYGAGGGVGRVVARTFAREGATVFLAGRTISSLQAVAQEISKAGGVAEVAKVDALSPQSVEEHLRKVVEKVGRLDISFNLISASVGMGRSLTELSDEQFMNFAFTIVRSNFLTATSAPPHIEHQTTGAPPRPPPPTA